MNRKAKKNLVSVIIPANNGEKYLAEAFESVFNQTYTNYEVIIVDDGSTDHTMQIIENYERPLSLIRQRHLGAGAARNSGVRNSQGEFIAFLDQDDYWISTKLENQISVLNNNPEIDGVIAQVKNVQQSKWSLKEHFDKPLLTNTMAGYCPSAILIRREAFFDVGFFEERTKLGETIDWFARAKEAEIKIKVLPDLLVWRRIHATNNGIRNRAEIKDYVRVLKQSIDRRRLKKKTSALDKKRESIK